MTITGDQVVSMCLDLGFALSGVCRAEPSEHENELRDWLSQGKHGSMAYLERNVELRLDAGAMLEGARTLIMVADQYATRGRGEDGGGADDSTAAGRVARYAQGRDYHVEMKKRLHHLCDALRQRAPGREFRAFVDSAPILEREHAARAGLGWIGKHTLLIHPERGSWLLLGGVVTSLPIAPPAEQRAVADHCGSCTRCIDACPTGAISPYSIDARRCISYLTIERRGSIDESFDESIGEWIFGCDVCQEVCPHNSPRPTGAEVGSTHDAYAPKHIGFDLLAVLGWSEDNRRREFQSSALKRATLDMMRRNALIAAGAALERWDEPALRRRIESIAADGDEDEMVRATARRTLERINRRTLRAFE